MSVSFSAMSVTLPTDKHQCELKKIGSAHIMKNVQVHAICETICAKNIGYPVYVLTIYISYIKIY